MKVQFNTGRYYTAEGQKIVAVVVKGGIFFRDHSRGIDGYIVCNMQHMSESDVKDNVMLAYDRGMYSYHDGVYAIDLRWEEGK